MDPAPDNERPPFNPAVSLLGPQPSVRGGVSPAATVGMVPEENSGQGLAGAHPAPGELPHETPTVAVPVRKRSPHNGAPWGTSRDTHKPTPEQLAALMFDTPMPPKDPAMDKRIDFLCDACGHTVSTLMGAVSRKQLNRAIHRLHLNCPRCGKSKCCERIQFADPSLVPTHEWSIREGNVFLERIQE